MTASPSEHTWTQTSVTLHCFKRIHGRASFPNIVIDFALLGVRRGGLLEECIVAANCPLTLSYASAFARILKHLATIPQSNKILGTPTGQLNFSDIHHLFWLVENEIQRRNYNRSAYANSLNARRVFLFCREDLASGGLVSTSGFKSRFPHDTYSTKKIISEMFDTTFSDAELAAPVSAIGFNDFPDHKARAQRHLEARLNRYTGACEAVFDRYEEFKKQIVEIKSKPLPSTIHRFTRQCLGREGGYPTPKGLCRLSEDDHLHIALKVVERDKIYQHNFPKALSITRISCLRPLALGTSQLILLSVLLSDYYLPRIVVTACFIVIMATTAWNASTVLSLTKENIRENRDGSFTLSGIKTRTDQNQESDLADVIERDSPIDGGPEHEVHDVTDARACRALRLLLWHDVQVTKYANRSSESIFVSQNLHHSLSDYRFDIARISQSMEQFCENEGLPHIVASAVRDQVANLEYLRSGEDINRISAILGHANITTTARYLNTHIIRFLNEANMKRYMDHLGPSIIFACGGESEVTRLGFSQSLISKQMLLPPTPVASDYADTLADKWLNAIGDIRLCITENEIEHCALQMKVYLKTMRKLVLADEKRFLAFHLPRIIFCRALYLIIKTSSHRSILTDFEEKMNAA